ncbi:hypothetical protein ACO1GZ_07410 [Fusobacterium watanabei]|uniref:hypothetical protein n=1 Tax=Fusobacterium watanabei TaxID=2686067 RepID=UPI003B586C4D
MDIFKTVELLVTAGGAFFVWQQLRFARKELKDRFTYQKREKAVELAKYFEKLLDDALIVTLVIEKSKISEIMKNLKINENRILLEEFNSLELKKIIPKFEKKYKDKRYSDFLKEIKNEDLKNIFMSYNLNYENQEKAIEIIKRIILKNMNRLEHFSMCFISDIAEEQIVYQSLHQVFLSYVEMSYILIARMNSNGGKDKYYTNIIELYKIWKKRYFHDLENEDKHLQQINKKVPSHPKF